MVSLGFLGYFKYVFDSVYNPEKTALINLAKEMGLKAVSGMGMLVMQAAKAEEYWYGASFKKEDMKQLIVDANDEMRRLFYEKKYNSYGFYGKWKIGYRQGFGKKAG